MTHDASSSPAQPRSATGRLEELSAEDCWRLVATRPVGRLAWTTPDGPTVVTVNFTVAVTENVAGARHHVHVRTAAYASAAREIDDSRVAFQVDDVDEDDRSGWSVLLRGRARLRPGSQAAPDPWVGGARHLGVDIEVEEVTGRRLVATG